MDALEQNWDREKGLLDRENSLKQGQLQLQITREIQKNMDDLSTLLLQLGGLVFLLSLAGYGAIKWIRNELHATMAKEIKTEVATLVDIAKKHNIERDWIENGRITLLNLDESKKDELERLLKDWGFKNIDPKVLTNFEPLKNKQQIVLFNDDICKTRQDLIWEYIEKCPDDTVFVAYSTINLPRNEENAWAWKKLITANMPATLFGQLMTAFRYQDALIRARS
ncbi:MAG: hypothetical protein HQL84_04995 [Magnetococcales bacterium]|nr:hypothetical protein [Magnetococcales bacterium]MBF0149387.1 hypothetical protein [Magnetococcales bacterium]